MDNNSKFTAQDVADLDKVPVPEEAKFTADDVVDVETESMSDNYPETVEPHHFLGIKQAPIMPDETKKIDPSTGKPYLDTMTIAAGQTADETAQMAGQGTRFIPRPNTPSITNLGVELGASTLENMPSKLAAGIQDAGNELTGVAANFFNQQAGGLIRPIVHSLGGQFPQPKTEAGKIAGDVSGVIGAVTSPLMRVIYGAEGAKASEIGMKLASQGWKERATRGAIGGMVYQGEGNLEDAVKPGNLISKAAMGAGANILVPPVITKTGDAVKGIGKFVRKNIAKFEDETAAIIKQYGISDVVTKAREATTYVLDTVVPNAQRKVVDMFVKGGKGIEAFYQDLKLSPDQIKIISRISKPIREKFAEVLMTGDRNKIVTNVNKARQAVGLEKGKLMAQMDTAYMKANKTIGALRKELIGKTLNINGTLDKDLYARATPSVKRLTDAYLTGMEKTGNRFGMSVYKLPARVMDTMGTWLDAAYKMGEGNSAAVARIAKIHSKEMGSQVNKYLKLPEGQRWGDIMDRYSQLSYLAKIGDKFGKLLNPNELEKALMSSVGKDAGRTGLQRSAEKVFGKAVVDDVRKFLATQDVINGKAASIGVTSKSGALQAMGAGAVRAGYHIAEEAGNIGKAVTKATSPLAEAVKGMAEEVSGGLNRFQATHGKIVEPGTWSKSTQEAGSKLASMQTGKGTTGGRIPLKKAVDQQSKLDSVVSEEDKLAKLSPKEGGGFNIVEGYFEKVMGGKPYTLKFAVSHKGNNIAFFNTKQRAEEFINKGSAERAVGATKMLGLSPKEGGSSAPQGGSAKASIVKEAASETTGGKSMRYTVSSQIPKDKFTTKIPIAEKIAKENKGWVIPDEEVEAIRKEYRDFLPNETTPLKHEKKATVLIGPATSGKSGMVHDIRAESGSAVVDSDYMKQMTSPYYKYGGSANPIVHEEISNKVEPLVLQDYLDEGANVVLPRIGKGTKGIQELITDLKKKGYEVNVDYIDKNISNVAKDTVIRFEKGGGKQYVPPKVAGSVAGQDINYTYEFAKSLKGVNKTRKYEWYSTGPGYKDRATRLIEETGPGRVRVPPRDAYIFSTDNVSEGSLLAQGIKDMSSSKLASHRKIVSDNVAEFLGVSHDAHPALGTWADGAEASSVHRFLVGTKDIPKVDKIMAKAARGDKQKEVLGFISRRGGKESLAIADIPLDKHSLEAIHKAIHASGIEYSTISKVGNNARILVYDKSNNQVVPLKKAMESLGLKSKVEVKYGERRSIGGWQNKRIETSKIARDVIEGRR